ncbi:type II secretion system protein GspL [Pseudohongiella spirulinae]|uniref:Type II secretion system protein L n=1 Tax=Pseudohongiella spirulinae TaxID=1249552 RepID=A0A0S2KFB8_9GAMM|nr:type II secretion system protein GspL [Pseudohongiella spirulinae]ALO47024.1 hypothetical protein PS2015_2390 [Pseudohongiella spirulinae]
MNTLAVQFLDQSDRYRWRACSRQGTWLSPSVEGSLDELVAVADGASLCLLLDGSDVLTRHLHFSAAEKKHLARLVPFELESVVAADISSLHVALAEPDGLTVTAAYLDKTMLRKLVEPLERAGLWVDRCYAIPHLLQADHRHWHMNIRDNNRVDLAWGQQATTVAADMLQVAIAALLTDVPGPLPEQITVSASQESTTQAVQSILNELLVDCQIDVVRLHDPWDALQPGISSAINLRQGAFAAPVRWQRLWKPLKMPAMASAAAVALFALSAAVEIQVNSSRFDRLQQQIETAYRRAVPQGMLVDAEQQLTAQIRQFRGGGNQSGLMPVLSAVAPVLLQYPQIDTHRLNFSAAQGELQLAVTAASNAEILTFTDALNESGLTAQARNISSAGDRQQASLLISGRGL